MLGHELQASWVMQSMHYKPGGSLPDPDIFAMHTSSPTAMEQTTTISPTRTAAYGIKRDVKRVNPVAHEHVEEIEKLLLICIANISGSGRIQICDAKSTS